MNKKGEKEMPEIYYIPAICEDSYAPSWTGNSTYPIIAIRGIFDSREKAKESIKGWQYEDNDNIGIITYYFEPDEEDEEDSDHEEPKAFNIDYNYKILTLEPNNIYGDYKINEVVNEEYSAVWDEYEQLGVTDY